MDFFVIFGFILLGYVLLELFGLCEIVNARYFRKWNKIKIPPKEENQCTRSIRMAFYNRFPRIRMVKDIFPFFSCLHYYYIDKGYNCAQKFPEFNSNGFHDAIIVTHGEYSKRMTYGEGIDLIIKKFQKSKIPYKIYDCQNICDFIPIVKNPLTKNLWIFGHGDRGGILIGFDYLDYKEAFQLNPQEHEILKKDHIYQFHCNCGVNPSLADILSDGKGYVCYTYRSQLQNREHIRQILEMFD